MTQKIAINSRSNGKFREEVLNNRPHIVTEMMSIEGDSTMNGLFYPDDQVTNSFKQLDMKPAPAGHPTANGENISAFHPLATNAFNVGGFVRNSRKEGKRVYNELVFDLEVANKDDRGKEIVSRIKNGQKIGVSTGLNASVINNGDKREVRDIEFDHVAVLLNETPAGENTFTVNKELIICNMGEPSGEPEINQNREVKDMEKLELVLAAIGNKANSLEMKDKERLLSMSEKELADTICNSAVVDIEAATKVIESKGMTINSQQDKEGYDNFLVNKADFDAYMAEKKAKIAEKVSTIVNHEGSDFTEADLAGKDESFLDKMIGTLKPTPRYDAQDQPLTNSDRDVDARDVVKY